MKRRDFLSTTVPAAVAMPALLNGFSFTAHSKSQNALAWLLGETTDTDHVFVLIQLGGGNDGLNMVIPLDLYANYYNARTNVAIPQSQVLRLDGTDKSGLHPAMTALQKNPPKQTKRPAYPNYHNGRSRPDTSSGGRGNGTP